MSLSLLFCNHPFGYGSYWAEKVGDDDNVVASVDSVPPNDDGEDDS